MHRPRPRQNPRKPRGFTLMEVLLVLAIIGVILAMVVPQLLGQQRVANIKATHSSIKSLESILDIYALDHDGNYPGTNEGLQALIVQPANDPQWKGPYLKNTTEFPQDAWHNPIQYQFPGTHNKDKPDIWSWGPDKQDGSPDDIANWNPPPV